MSNKFHINSIEELDDIVVKASRMRDHLVRVREELASNNEWKKVATVIHEKRCQRESQCSWEKEHIMDSDTTGEIISEYFIDWNGSERLFYAEKAKYLLSKTDSDTIILILEST